MSSPLQDRVFIITGGSKGFGLAIAQSLIVQGAKVGLLGRSKSSLEAAVGKLGEDNALGIAADVAHKEDITAAFTQVKKHFGRLDGLINNAGVARPSTVENLVEEEVIQQVQTAARVTVTAATQARNATERRMRTPASAPNSPNITVSAYSR